MLKVALDCDAFAEGMNRASAAIVRPEGVVQDGDRAFARSWWLAELSSAALLNQSAQHVQHDLTMQQIHGVMLDASLTLRQRCSGAQCLLALTQIRLLRI